MMAPATVSDQTCYALNSWPLVCPNFSIYTAYHS